MIASLYFLPESFTGNNALTEKQLDEKVSGLLKDIIQINRNKATNKLYANYDEVYNVDFYKGINLKEIFTNPNEIKKQLNRDLVNRVLSVFQNVDKTTFNQLEVIELANLHEEDSCNGIIAFNEVSKVKEEHSIVYGIKDWYKFRRYFLGIYPKNEEFFIDECSKYCPNLFIHERNKTTISRIFKNFHKSVIKHLGYLNDVFYVYRTKTFVNESIKYQSFTSECNLEADAAPKDNNSVKNILTFKFLEDKGSELDVTCYPHIRLCKSDRSGDSTYYQHRIYFHEGIDTVKKKNILIAHIGEHL